MNEVNASVFEAIRTVGGGRRYFQIRGEVFNVNEPSELLVPESGSDELGVRLITSQSNRSRQIQIGVRLVFRADTAGRFHSGVDS